ncbi:MAG TPA: hypothetical protein VE010_20035 [Thermoanaerobaculia bacterium]|nr:hypothetical protein [Thermoanaerobaculia bacterium]
MNAAVPEPLTQRQRTILWCVALVCAASRFLAIAKSLWDWDEALLTLGMREYDVEVHHPHPPGFPVYIGLAKLVRVVAASDFRALQTVNVIAALLVFPALYFFARSLRFSFSISVMAAALFASFPNVWYFGGGAFSDVPSIVLVLFAVALLLRGAEDRNAYWLGTLLLALAIGIRPQNILVALLPGLYASSRRRPHEVLIALLIGVVVVGAAFGGAIYATGSFDQYMHSVRDHGQYIARVDSWRNPERPPMWRLADRFFIKQYQLPALGFIATIFVLVSLAGSIRERSRPMLFNALTFVPIALFAWAMLDRYSISRFSIAYQPMFALLLADGIARAAGKRAPLLAGALIAAFAIFTIPALNVVRGGVAPSLQAAAAVTRHVDVRHEQLFVGHTMSKFIDVVAPQLPYIRIVDDRAMPLSATRPAWLLAEITETAPSGLLFRRERGNLWNIARHHYFEIKLQRVEAGAQFVDGWYEGETYQLWEWRWMQRRSRTILPPAGGRTMLRMTLTPPPELIAQNAMIAVTLNGQLLETFRAGGEIRRDYRVKPASAGRPNVLELAIDKSAMHEGREVGLKLQDLGWGPA